MTRRSTADRSPQPVDYGPEFAAWNGELAQGSEKKPARRATRWPGAAGGRWVVWVLRGLLWLVLLIVGYNGVLAIVHSETAPIVVHRPALSYRSTFPQALASAYALQFGQVYLNASPATAGQRAAGLAAFLPPGTDSQLGWDGSGSLQLQSEQVANVKVLSPARAVVTLLARVNGQLMELGVPLYYAHNAIVVSGEPAWLPAPPRAAVPSPSPPSQDSAAQAVLTSQLPAFFEAYASGNHATLDRFLAPGTHVVGLGGAVTFGSLTSVLVPSGGTTRHIVVTIVWHVPAPAGSQATNSSPAGLEMTYAMTIVQINGNWYVSQINTAPHAAGLP